MKLLGVLVIAYIGVLAAAPLVCGLSDFIPGLALSCATENNSCTAEQANDCDQPCDTDTEAPCIPCCPVQSCTCYFVALPQFDFVLKDITTIIQKMPLQNESALSAYVADCWHPPEII